MSLVTSDRSPFEYSGLPKANQTSVCASQTDEHRSAIMLYEYIMQEQNCQAMQRISCSSCVVNDKNKLKASHKTCIASHKLWGGWIGRNGGERRNSEEYGVEK